MPVGGGYAMAGGFLRWRLHVMVTGPVVGHGGAVLQIRDCSGTALRLVSYSPVGGAHQEGCIIHPLPPHCFVHEATPDPEVGRHPAVGEVLQDGGEGCDIRAQSKQITPDGLAERPRLQPRHVANEKHRQTKAAHACV